MSGGISLDHLMFAASVCDKYCSKIAALTNLTPEDETTSCERCLHWNDKPCFMFNRMCNSCEAFS